MSTDVTFKDLDLPPELLRAVEELGYEQPTPIQARAIPPLLQGRDLLGQAQTGTGKTAAFALPLLARIDLEDHEVQAIVLTPTRELAMQVAEATRSYGKHLGQRGISVLPVYGGQPMHIQRNALARGVNVVIGTPGRVKDHLERGTLSLAGVRFFGLDEADEMLKMGFIDDVEWILEHSPAERQIALFSATLPTRVRRIAERHLKNPVDLKIAHKAATVPTLEQFAMRVARHEKLGALERVLEAEDFEAVLVFAGTQRATADLAERLQAHGHAAECIHGGMNQAQREAVVKRLKSRNTHIVIATDVAARGLDVDHISLVINYDLPPDVEVYVHRVGRTGRAGRTGKAISFQVPRDRNMLKAIERFVGCTMQTMRIPGRAEIVDLRRERFQDKLRAQFEGELGEFRNMARTMQTEEDIDLLDLAAAALRNAWGESPLYVAPEPEPARHSKPVRTFDDGEYVEIVIPVGSWNRIQAGSIVRAIATESKLPGSVVGRIKILDKVSFVGVPGEHVARIMKALKGTRLGGRVIHPRLASDSGRR
jgi:ATP-dependent RNA helicase DeaD